MICVPTGVTAFNIEYNENSSKLKSLTIYKLRQAHYQSNYIIEYSNTIKNLSIKEKAYTLI